MLPLAPNVSRAARCWGGGRGGGLLVVAVLNLHYAPHASITLLKAGVMLSSRLQGPAQGFSGHAV